MSKNRRNLKKIKRRHTFIHCKCGRDIIIMKPYYSQEHGSNGLKSHAHCRQCLLEWHLLYDGTIYAHKWRPKTEGI